MTTYLQKSKEVERWKKEADYLVSQKETFSRNLGTEATSVSQVVVRKDGGSLHHYFLDPGLIYYEKGYLPQKGYIGQLLKGRIDGKYLFLHK